MFVEWLNEWLKGDIDSSNGMSPYSLSRHGKIYCAFFHFLRVKVVVKGEFEKGQVLDAVLKDNWVELRWDQRGMVYQFAIAAQQAISKLSGLK